MMRKILGIVLIGFLCAGVALAQEKKAAGLSDWLKGIQKKIDNIVPKKTPPMSTGVAGVRGAKENDKAKLYWKGKKGEEPVTEEELAKFKSGVDLAAKGDKPGAAKELEDFMKQYPDSAFIPDAKKTLDLVKAEPK